MTGTGPDDDVLLRLDRVEVEFSVGGRTVHAVSGVSLDVRAGETLGVVGESGCGKSSMARAIVQMPPPTRGRVVFRGVDLSSLSANELRRVRTRLQFVFQDPIASLNPRHRIADIVAEPMRIWGRGSRAEREERAAELLGAVGLDPATAAGRRPHQFSGGQCQRIALARALALEPDLVICDEPVSALDVSVQAQILNLLEDLKERYALTLVFIAHDLAVVKNVSDRVAVMYLGKLCEIADPDDLYSRPAHPYTELLLRSVPVADPRVRPVAVGSGTGEPPSPFDPPSGCRFRTRCPRVEERCALEEPPLRPVAGGHLVACHHPLVPVAAPAPADPLRAVR